jgi:hypothetical protein
LDPLLQCIQQRHPEAWGHVLDAGTGDSSLSWLVTLDSERWTAVCAEAQRAAGLRGRYGSRFRPQDRLLVGQWQDETFLRGELYDTVIADYVLGSVDRYAPHFQEALLSRLCAACGGWLYLTGLEPYSSGWLLQLARFRDAVLLLSGRRPHRELPLQWVQARLQQAGAEIVWSERFRNHYDSDFVRRELAAVEENLGELEDRGLAQVLKRRAHGLREAGLDTLQICGTLGPSEDYIIAARFPGPANGNTNMISSRR